MSKPATTIGNVRDDIPPRDTLPTDALAIVLAYVVLCPLATAAVIAVLGFGPSILAGIADHLRGL